MFNFNLDDIEDAGFDELPPGNYSLQAEKATVEDTKDGTGQYISCEFNVIGGDHSGRKIFSMFNVVNKSEKAENIGKSMLKAMIVSSGADIQIFTGPDQLIGLECDAVIKTQKGKDGYEDRSVIKKFIEAPVEMDSSEAVNVEAEAAGSENAFD